MASSAILADDTWNHLYNFFKSCKKIHTKNEAKLRSFMEAILWMVRSGAQWRLLPEKYGDWNTVYHRFADWSAKGIWKMMFEYFASDHDLEFVMIDASIMRAHACAAGAKKGGRSIR